MARFRNVVSSKENRIYASYNELSPHLIKALIATEDIRFKNHSGIDAKALLRAIVKRGLLFQSMQGEILLQTTLNYFIPLRLRMY